VLNSTGRLIGDGMRVPGGGEMGGVKVLIKVVEN